MLMMTILIMMMKTSIVRQYPGDTWMQAIIGNRHPPNDRSGKCSMGQASHITGPRRCVRRNDNDMNAYDDYDGDDDENKKSNWLLHRSTNCCQNSSIRSQLSSHQALLLTADWWWCLLWERKKMNETFTISYSPWKTWKQQKPSWTLHDLIIDQTSCDSEIVAWGQKADILPFIRSFLTEFVCCTYIMDHACRDSCMRGSRRCSKGSARVPLIQSCQYFVHPWSWWFDVDDESDNDDDDEWW